ncbi:MAG: hypothetical protein EXR77_04105 [Myxococcales bacterium]|nr:hypothetical protein [Myxococcales bacterium]
MKYLSGILLLAAACGTAPAATPVDSGVVQAADSADSIGESGATAIDAGCNSDKACDDHKPCTIDACSNGVCEYIVKTSKCDDGNPCTIGEACIADACAGGKAAACDDGKPCTDDACDPAQGCTATANSKPCEDGNPCTLTDTCLAGSCTGGPAGPCDDTNPCTTDSCSGVKADCTHAWVISDTCSAKLWPQFAVRVTSPAGGDWIEASASSIELSGYVLGLPQSVTWSNADGKFGSASIQLPRFSAAVPLAVGDNPIVFTAVSGGQAVHHKLTVVYPGQPVFIGGPRPYQALSPAAATQIGLRIAIDSAVLPKLLAVDVFSVTADGKPLDSIAILGDDAGPCDGQAQDGQWAACVPIPQNVGKVLRLRVRATLKQPADLPPLHIWSLPASVDILAPTPGACTTLQKLTQDYAAKLGQATAKDGPVAARKQILIQLLADDQVAEAGENVGDSGGVWLRSASGLLGIVTPPAGVYRGGAATDSYSGATLDPDVPTPHEIGTLNNELFASGCKRLTAFVNTSQVSPLAAATIGVRRGLVVMVAHGGAGFGGLSAAARLEFGWHHPGAQEFIAVQQTPCSNAALNSTCLSAACNETQVCSALGQGPNQSQSCLTAIAADLRDGRLAVLNGDHYAILPPYWQRHALGMPRSVVYLGACNSSYNGSMALELLAAGAAAVVGYSGRVTHAEAYAAGHDWLSTTLAGKGAGAGLPVAPSTKDWQLQLRLLGDAAATVGTTELANGSLEQGLTGWLSGDGAVAVQHLGPIEAKQGKTMALLHNETGGQRTLRQSLCVPAGGAKLCFQWRYLSAEFGSEGCATADPFTVTVRGNAEGKATELMRIDPQGACDFAACTTCGGAQGLLKASQVAIGTGDWASNAKDSDWQQACLNLVAWQGKRVEVRFDLGTTAGNATAVLVDEVVLQ